MTAVAIIILCTLCICVLVKTNKLEKMYAQAIHVASESDRIIEKTKNDIDKVVADSRTKFNEGMQHLVEAKESIARMHTDLDEQANRIIEKTKNDIDKVVADSRTKFNEGMQHLVEAKESIARMHTDLDEQAKLVEEGKKALEKNVELVVSTHLPPELKGLSWTEDDGICIYNRLHKNMHSALDDYNRVRRLLEYAHVHICDASVDKDDFISDDYDVYRVWIEWEKSDLLDALKAKKK